MPNLTRVAGNCRVTFALIGAAWLIGLCLGADSSSRQQPSSPFNAKVGRGDWPQLGGTPHRNNEADGANIPIDWNIDTGKNIKWSAVLGSQTYGNIVVANGRIFVGTNNNAGYLKRYPAKVDLGVLLCFRESDGEFLWQYSSEKLPTGRIHDWPQQGICSAPVVEGDRLWFVTNRGEVVCLDAEGFRDEENDGPFTSEKRQQANVVWDESHEADTLWSFDMMQELGVRQHNMATCAPTIWGDVLFICTSNGVDEGHVNIPAPDAPSFMAMDKQPGEVLWTDKSPGRNIMHGQWSCPAAGVFAGVPQVLFPGGDGWLYSFRADRWDNGKPELLWKFDGNPKQSIYLISGRATRNGIIAIPVIHDDLVYLAMGEDPEHGEGPGHLWCIDPTKRGDVSPELVLTDSGEIVPHRKLLAFYPWDVVFNIVPADGTWERLDQLHLPESIRAEFLKNQVTLPNEATVKLVSKGTAWLIEAEIAGDQRQFKLERRWDAEIRGPGRNLWVGRPTTEKLVPNPNSAVVWHYDHHDQNGNGNADFEETMHRTLGSPAIKNNLLFITDFSGLVHCLNATTGQPHWTCDLLAACWTTPLIAGESVYVADEDGDVAVFSLSADRSKSVKDATDKGSGAIYEPLHQINMENAIYTMPTVANNVLYIACKNELFAITNGGNGASRHPPKP
jgi:outer membrane protein assembly factor BamB